MTPLLRSVGSTLLPQLASKSNEENIFQMTMV
jgi:hypothetical protein